MAKTMITTIDNPFDPFTQFDAWWNFDTRMGYRTYERIAAIANDSFELLDSQRDYEFEQATNSLLEIFPNLYKIVYEKNEKTS